MAIVSSRWAIVRRLQPYAHVSAPGAPCVNPIFSPRLFDYHAMVEIPYKPKGKPTEEFVDFDGASFKTTTWKVPEDKKYRGKIIYVHGFMEHASIYTEYFDHLSQNGYEVFFFDQRGAGETSPGPLLGLTDEAHTFNDLDFMIKRNLEQRKDKAEKFYLMGHSMGGGIILNYGIRGKYKEHIKGIVACGPLVILHPKTRPNFVVQKLSPLLNKLAPRFQIDTKLNYDYVTSNERWKTFIKQLDKKLIGLLRQLYDMFQRGEALERPEYVGKFSPDISLLIVHGESDYINDIKGTTTFFNLLANNIDKKFVPIKGGRHSLFIEREELFNQVLHEVLEYLNGH